MNVWTSYRLMLWQEPILVLTFLEGSVIVHGSIKFVQGEGDFSEDVYRTAPTTPGLLTTCHELIYGYLGREFVCK